MSDHPNRTADTARTVVGFTGTRHGMTTAQVLTVKHLIGTDYSIVEVHHGDCVGADADCHQIAMSEGANLVVHPPVDNRLRAFCDKAFEAKAKECGVTVEVLDPKPYHDRNRDIVDACDYLIATPQEVTPQDKGGTWGTIGYARAKGKRNIIVYPDGSTLIDGSMCGEDSHTSP